jgi:cell shape-determining protein MreD
MNRMLGYSACLYFAFAWQAALRPEMLWHGFSPNFLALVLIGSCVLLRDISALFAATALGLMSDCLAPQGLGPDVLCYLGAIIVLQAICPPKLVRNPAVLLVILMMTTALVELSGTVLRATLSHELVWSDSRTATTITNCSVIAAGDGLYTALLAVFPLLVIKLLSQGVVQESQDAFANRWHRLTSF